MTNSSPFRTIRFRVLFSVLAWIWAIFHMLVLHSFGFAWILSIWDSLISNLLLMSIAFLMTVVLQFYIPQKSRYSYLLALCGILTFIWFFTSRLILFSLFKQDSRYASFFDQSGAVRTAFAFLIISCMALISLLWYTIQDQQEIDKRKNEADRLSREAELFTLRQQLQPHFLFNSLNSINALIGTRPLQARVMIEHLSDFLRGVLKKDNDQWVSLKEELHQLNLYLEIEKVRFGHRLSATVTSNESTDQLKLPALLLQPVLENAIKFGLYDTIGEINVSIDCQQQDTCLVITISNPFDPETNSNSNGTGFGLRSVHRRLYLLFARNDLLTTSVKQNLFFTAIKIPQIT